MLPKLICYFRCNVCFLYFSTKSLWKSFKDRCAKRFRFVSECKSTTGNHSDKIFLGKILRKIDFWGDFGERGRRNERRKWQKEVERGERKGKEKNRGERWGRRDTVAAKRTKRNEGDERRGIKGERKKESGTGLRRRRSERDMRDL